MIKSYRKCVIIFNKKPDPEISLRDRDVERIDIIIYITGGLVMCFHILKGEIKIFTFKMNI